MQLAGSSVIALMPATTPKTGLPPGPWAGGSIEEHDREQDNNATIGAGTIIIRDQENQKQDVASINRDLEQAQVITKDESSGTEFYASSSSINTLWHIDQAAPQLLKQVSRRFDELQAMGNALAGVISEALQEGRFSRAQVEELQRELDSCLSKQGFNLLDFFVTPAYAQAATPCDAAVINKAIKYLNDNKDEVMQRARDNLLDPNVNRAALEGDLAAVKKLQDSLDALQDCVDYANRQGTSLIGYRYTLAEEYARKNGTLLPHGLLEMEYRAASGDLSSEELARLEEMRAQADQYLILAEEDSRYQERLNTYNNLINSEGFQTTATVLTQNQIAVASINQMYRTLNAQVPNNGRRVVGALQAAGGLVMVAAGTAGTTASGGTAAALGWIGIGLGVDELETGLRQTLSGLDENSNAYTAILASCNAVGGQDCSTRAAVLDFAVKAATAFKLGEIAQMGARGAGISGLATDADVTASFQHNRRFWTSEPIEFNGNRIYQRNDLIDPNKIDPISGKSNLELMRMGRAPLGPDGKPINLHHLTQTQSGAIAEVTQTLHNGNHSILHMPNTIPSGINRAEFNTWRRNYWQNRANDF